MRITAMVLALFALAVIQAEILDDPPRPTIQQTYRVFVSDHPEVEDHWLRREVVHRKALEWCVTNQHLCGVAGK